MTMILSSLTPYGGVVITDSRASWSGGERQDSLQKAIEICPNIILAYAGDVQVAGNIAKELTKLALKHPRRGYLDVVGMNLSRTAKYFYEDCRQKTNRDLGLSLILSGVKRDETIKSWWLETPTYHLTPLEKNQIRVLGSGTVVTNELVGVHNKTILLASSLKAYADELLINAESALRQYDGVLETVGGMLQVWLVDKNGISPLNHSFVDLNPVDGGEAKSISFEDGNWVQRDHRKKELVSVVRPDSIITGGPKEIRTQDFERIVQKDPKWTLNHFLTFTDMELGHGLTKFHGLGTQFGHYSYPASIPYPLLWAGVAFRGPVGKRLIEISLVTNEGKRELRKDLIEIIDPLEGFEYYAPLNMVVDGVGQVFLECKIDDMILSRRSLFFGLISPEFVPMSEHGDKISSILTEQHRALGDPALTPEHPAEVVYFHLCQESNAENMMILFDKQFTAVYWRKYPFTLPVNVASSFRMSKGKHKIVLKLINATSRSESIIATKDVYASSSTLAVPVHGDIMVIIPMPGLYFVNAYVDDVFSASTLFVAEDTKPRFAYELADGQLKSVESGENYLMMLRRSHKEGEQESKNIMIMKA